MSVNHSALDNPIAVIRRCVTERKIYWTYHINMRLKRRHIPRNAITSSTEHYEIIESYPDDKYFPCYLVYSRYQDKVFHVLFGVDVDSDNVRVITAYYPNLQKWEPDYKTRRRAP